MMLSSDHVLQEEKGKRTDISDKQDSLGPVQLSVVTSVITGVTAEREQKDSRHKRAKQMLKTDKVAML